MTQIVIGSRGSALALAQANWVSERIKLHNPGVEVRIEVIKTKGDKILDTPLSRIGDKGLFVKEIEAALIEKKIDLAVHSMKDLPSDSNEALIVAAIPERVDPCDVLVSKSGGLDQLTPGSRVGTSSLRRKAQLLHHRPDLEFFDLRGNLDTRIAKLESGDYDAIILAFAGLHRLGLDDKITEKIPFDVSLPAVGQGALAVQIRKNDAEMMQIVAPIDDPVSRAAVSAERALLSALGGGCQTPIAALAQMEQDSLVLRSMVSSLDGREVIRATGKDSAENAESLGKRTAEVLLESGANDILQRITEPDEIGPV